MPQSDQPFQKQGALLWKERHAAGVSTQAEAAELIGISHRAYSDYERGAREMPEHKLDALLRAFKAYKPTYATIAHSVGNTKSMASQGQPVFNLKALGGELSLDPSKAVGFIPAIIRDSYWITAVGDSMEPTIRANSAIQAVPFDGHIADIHQDGVYLFRMDTGIHIKRLQVVPGRRVRVMSDNPRYDTYEIPVDDDADFEVLGRVVLC